MTNKKREGHAPLPFFRDVTDQIYLLARPARRSIKAIARPKPPISSIPVGDDGVGITGIGGDVGVGGSVKVGVMVGVGVGAGGETVTTGPAML